MRVLVLASGLGSHLPQTLPLAGTALCLPPDYPRSSQRVNWPPPPHSSGPGHQERLSISNLKARLDCQGRSGKATFSEHLGCQVPMKRSHMPGPSALSFHAITEHRHLGREAKGRGRRRLIPDLLILEAKALGLGGRPLVEALSPQAETGGILPRQRCNKLGYVPVTLTRTVEMGARVFDLVSTASKSQLSANKTTMTTILEDPRISPGNPLMDDLLPLLTTHLDAAKVSTLLKTVNDSLRPWTALWNLWDAFFTVVVHSSAQAQRLAFIGDVRAHPPTKPKSKGAPRHLGGSLGADGQLHWSDLPGFGTQWSDAHGVLEARREWNISIRGPGKESPLTTYATLHLQYCGFSASLLKTMGRTGGVHPVRVFYEARNTLERDVPLDNDRGEGKMRPRDVWDLDVRVAAIWIRDGAGRLWDVDAHMLRQDWGNTLDSATDRWPRMDGLTLERWRLWRKRVRGLGGREELGDETKRVLSQAAQVLEDLLGLDVEGAGLLSSSH